MKTNPRSRKTKREIYWGIVLTLGIVAAYASVDIVIEVIHTLIHRWLAG